MPNCSPPPYIYRPDFIEDDNVPCVLDAFFEIRGRAPVGLGGTFFRTKDVGTNQNLISIEMLYNAAGDYFTLIVRDDGTEVEVFGGGSPPPYPTQGVPDVDGNCSPNLIDNFRADVNTNSAYIEMPTTDYGGEFLPTVPIFEAADDDAGCLSPFGEIFFAGGEGPPISSPATIGSPPQSQPRTGPERTLYMIIHTEVITGTPTDTGELFDIPTADKIKQWNGTAWVAYEPNVC